VDVVSVVDRSGFVDEYMSMVKDFLRDVWVLLGIYTADFRMGVVVYDGSASNYITLDIQGSMMTQINRLPDTTSGGTNIDAGIIMMMEQFEY
jgi:hypothetical protein